MTRVGPGDSVGRGEGLPVPLVELANYIVDTYARVGADDVALSLNMDSPDLPAFLDWLYQNGATSGRFVLSDSQFFSYRDSEDVWAKPPSYYGKAMGIHTLARPASPPTEITLSAIGREHVAVGFTLAQHHPLDDVSYLRYDQVIGVRPGREGGAELFRQITCVRDLADREVVLSGTTTYLSYECGKVALFCAGVRELALPLIS